MKAIVVIPTYNEVENIYSLIPEVLAQDPCLEVLIVDDNSPDGTGQLAEEMAATEPRLHVLHRSQKEGLGRAYLAGFKWALDHGADYIFEMDADYSHDPNRLPAFLEAVQQADLVIGSRYTAGGGTENWPLWRKLMSKGGSLYARTVLGTGIKDLTGGFKCFRRQVLEAIDLDTIQASGYGFQIELTYRTQQAGFRIAEIPITFADRQFGHSKMNKAIFLEAMLLVLKLRFGTQPVAQPAPAAGLPTTGRRSMKILQVIAEAPPIKSGVAKVAAELTAGFEARGHHVDTLSSSDIPRRSFGEFRFSAFIFYWLAWQRRLKNYDLINVHAPAPTFTDLFLLLAGGLCWRRRKRIILTYHSEIDLPGVIIKPMSRLYSWLHKKMAMMAGHTIVTSPSYAAMFDGTLPAERLSVIPWGVEPTAFEPPAEKTPGQTLRVAFVGQLRPYKGVDILLRSMAMLPGVQLNIIGGGHHEQSYRQMAQALNLKNINFLGKVSDENLQAVLKASDVLALPSLTMAEAFGIVLLEAMAAGCVPIASNLPGVRDVVGQAGFTFPVGDFAALAQLLGYLRDHPDVVTRYAHQAQAKARRYTWQRTLEAHHRLFQQTLVAAEVAESVQSGKSGSVAILEAVASHLAMASSTLYQGTRASGFLTRQTTRGQNYHWPSGVTYQRGILGYVFEQNQTLLLPDDVEQTYLAPELGPLADRSILVTSFATANGEQALLCFSRGPQQTPFTREDKRWLVDTMRQLAGETAPADILSIPEKWLLQSTKAQRSRLAPVTSA